MVFLFILEILDVSFQILDMHLPLIGSDCCFIVPTVAWGGQSNLEITLIRLWKKENAGGDLFVVVSIFCHWASLNPTASACKPKFGLVLSFLLNQLFSFYVQRHLLTELAAAK